MPKQDATSPSGLSAPSPSGSSAHSSSSQKFKEGSGKHLDPKVKPFDHDSELLIDGGSSTNAVLY